MDANALAAPALPSTIEKEPPTQWAAVRTHVGAMSVPPQKWYEDERETCHFHSHGVAACPPTMRSLRASHGVSSGPFAPHKGAGVGGGTG
eukprot:3964365-Pyramimonas_sp.AAC.1